MKTMTMGMGFVALVGFVALGCDKGSSDATVAPEAKGAKAAGASVEGGKAAEAKPANVAPAAETAKAAEPAKAEGAVTRPDQQTYPLDAIKAVDETCATPEVLLSTAPKSVGPDHPWHTARQALLANQQFRVVSGAPSVPGEVSLATYAYSDTAYALVAKCKDGGTCNRLAAMYKAIVRSSRPQVVCGAKIQGISGGPVHGFGWEGDPKANLPGSGDTIAMCARIDACMIATDQATPGDPFLECQKAPSKFKTACAKQYPCAEVMACLGK